VDRDVHTLSVALRESFIALDQALREHVSALVGEALTPKFLKMKRICRDKEATSGCTALATVVTPSALVCANAGDSRCVLVSRGDGIPLSHDHKPVLPEESERIRAAGGSVCSRGRVDGRLSVSRAIGDFEFKCNKELGPEGQRVSPEPEVEIAERSSGTPQVLLLACDGVWDVMDNQHCSNCLMKELQQGKTVVQACKELCQTCLTLCSTDNISIVALDLGYYSGIVR